MSRAVSPTIAIAGGKRVPSGSAVLASPPVGANKKATCPASLLLIDLGSTDYLPFRCLVRRLADPLNLAIYRYKLQGTFVEPQRYYFERLRNTYAGFSGLRFLQCAIAENAGMMPMYSLDCSSGLLPRWAHGVGTLSRAQLLRLADQIPDVEKYIVTDNVTCVSVHEPFERTPIINPDIVVVDAEGIVRRPTALPCSIRHG